MASVRIGGQDVFFLYCPGCGRWTYHTHAASMGDGFELVECDRCHGEHRIRSESLEE